MKGLWIVIITMQYSDDNMADEVFGPFAQKEDAYEWKEENVADRHQAFVRQLSDPNKDYGEHAWWSWE